MSASIDIGNVLKSIYFNWHCHNISSAIRRSPGASSGSASLRIEVQRRSPRNIVRRPLVEAIGQLLDMLIPRHGGPLPRPLRNRLRGSATTLGLTRSRPILPRLALGIEQRVRWPVRLRIVHFEDQQLQRAGVANEIFVLARTAASLGVQIGGFEQLVGHPAVSSSQFKGIGAPRAIAAAIRTRFGR
jgi:hypothetical protein